MTFSGWIATVAGWYVTEIGRQPYVVYGWLKTADVASNVASPWIALTLTMYVTLYSALIVAYIGVIKYMAEKPWPVEGVGFDQGPLLIPEVPADKAQTKGSAL
jgi:cytochrome d ubiquinol oxidase subunit I